MENITKSLIGCLLILCAGFSRNLIIGLLLGGIGAVLIIDIIEELEKKIKV